MRFIDKKNAQNISNGSNLLDLFFNSVYYLKNMIKNNFMTSQFFIYFSSLFLLIGCTINNACFDEREFKSEYIKNTDWTIMHYCAGDSNGLASYLCNDIEEIINGYKGNCNVLVFIDVGESNEYVINGELFSGTCIFRVEKNKLTRIDLHDVCEDFGAAVDSADTAVLRAFISYCKKNYPAKYYGMFFGGHGGGVSSTVYSNTIFKNILFDGDTKRWICAVDLTNNLDESCSVDFLGIDLCYMGNTEFLYQIRKGNGGFSADYVTASAPEVWGEGLNYSCIYGSFTNGIMPKELACLVVTCQNVYTYMQSSSKPQARRQSLAAYDLSKIDNLKQRFDAFCNVMTDKKAIAECIRGKLGEKSQNDITHYFSSSSINGWKCYPYFDLYDFVRQLGETDESLKKSAEEVCEAIDELILDSFGRSFYSRFDPGKMGLSIFYPDFSIFDWDYMMWNQISSSGNECYGKLSWCTDNAQTGNWFTLLESWYKK